MPLSTSQETIHVLHVDDQSAFADLVAESLEAEDDRFTVETATDPREALDRLTEKTDCIVSDYDMPQMDGIELLTAVRETNPDLPFILFTGKGSEEVAGKAISAGVTDYLQKTAGRDQYRLLANRIENAVSQYRTEQQMSRALSAIESAHEGIGLLDTDGEFFYVNEAYADTLGYERQDLLGTHWETLYADEDLSYVYNEMLPEARNGGWRGTTDMLSKDRAQVTVNHELTYTEDGTLICTIQEYDDTARLKESLSLREQAMDQAPVGITITDPSQPDNPIIYANDGFTELTGYSREEIMGRNCRFLQGAETSDEPVAAMREAIDAGEPVSVTLRNYRKDGEMFWNRVCIAPLRADDGTLTNYVGFQQDVTERVEYKQGLEEQNERLDEFASIVSHDLRNPLNVATSRLQLAQEDCQSKHLDTIEDAHERMEELIEDMLTLAREGSIATDIRPVRLAPTVEIAWQTVETGGATLRIETDTTIQADESRLRQLFENLIRNAVEHGTEDVEITVGALSGGTGFYVADDGGGIPAEESLHVFDSGYTTSKEGIGMGLSIVKRVTDAHGWEIELTGSDRGGAKFEITGVDTVD